MTSKDIPEAVAAFAMKRKHPVLHPADISYTNRE